MSIATTIKSIKTTELDKNGNEFVVEAKLEKSNGNFPVYYVSYYKSLYVNGELVSSIYDKSIDRDFDEYEKAAKFYEGLAK